VQINNGWLFNFENTHNLIACVNVNQNHWVTLTNIDVQTVVSPSVTTINKPVYLYDSLNDNRYLEFLEPLLSSMFKERNSFHVYKVHSFYPQISGNDFGLFALAYALMLCQSQEPSLVQFNQDTMRQSFNDCVERNMLDFNVEMLLNNTQTHIRYKTLYEISLKKIM
jgi:hypothetical protein